MDNHCNCLLILLVAFSQWREPEEPEGREGEQRAIGNGNGKRFLCYYTKRLYWKFITPRGERLEKEIDLFYFKSERKSFHFAKITTDQLHIHRL